MIFLSIIIYENLLYNYIFFTLLTIM